MEDTYQLSGPQPPSHLLNMNSKPLTKRIKQMTKLEELKAKYKNKAAMSKVLTHWNKAVFSNGK